jgi:hypothetical protein
LSFGPRVLLDEKQASPHQSSADPTQAGKKLN